MLFSRRALLRFPIASAVSLPLVHARGVPPLPAGTATRVVWIWPPAEQLALPQALAARGALRAALAYWNARAPLPGCFIAREEALWIDDPYTTHLWLYGLRVEGLLTIAVVVNLTSGRAVSLGGGVEAPAYNWPGQQTCYAFLVSGERYSHVGVGPQVAHELGHALYQLVDGDPAEPMMGDYADEWARWLKRQPCVV